MGKRLQLSLLIMILFLGQAFPADAKSKKRTCDYIEKPELRINIHLTIPEATYDYSRTSEEMTDERFESTVKWLQKQGIKSIGMARHLGQFIKIKGLTSGGYQVNMTGMGHARRVDRYGVYYCPFLTDLNIEFFYATKIFIAKEIPRDSCEFEETMKHEWKHHTANVMAIKTYSDRLKKDLPTIVREIEERQGYVDASQIQNAYKQIEHSVNDMINIYYETIWKDQRKRNSLIDTPEEYQRVERVIQECEKRRKAK